MAARWQSQWHDCLDAVGSATPRPAPLPDIGEDFRLHFDLWSAPPEARRAAFKGLPRGDALLARVDHVLTGAAGPLGPEEAQDTLHEALSRLAVLGIDAPSAETPATLLGPNEPGLHDAFADADSPAIDLDDTLADRARQVGGTLAEEAYFFLSEPLYRLRSDYDVAHWVIWPLCAGPEDPDVYAPLCRPALGGWSAGLSSSRGLFLYDRRQAG